MSKFCPVYPQPKRSKLSRWRQFFSARGSWLDGLYERSYSMQMGEIQLASTKLFMINQPELVRKVLVEELASFPKHRELARALEPVLGQSILTTNGSQWQQQRVMMNPAFEQVRLSLAFPRMRDAALDMLGRLSKSDLRKPYDADAEMTRVTADIIFRTIFSRPIADATSSALFDAFARYQLLASKTSLPALYNLTWLVPFWTRNQRKRIGKQIREELATLLRPRFDAARAGAVDSQDDILSALLSAANSETGEGFTFEAVLDQIAVLFFAGHETSASALTWALHLISHSPDIQTRMQQEIGEVCGTEMPTASQLRELSLTRNVFREALRLFPPVGFLAREASKPSVMRDKQVGAGSAVVISPWLIHRHRELWADADAFDPDRFDTAPGKASARCAYLPFGMGPRVCIGAAFAQQEASLILACLVQRFHVRPALNHTPLPVGRLTIRSGNGMPLLFEKRAA
jgi:cytochrome P450